MDNAALKKIQKRLKKFFTYFKHNDILVVSEDKADLPFAYVIMDEEGYPGIALISYAVNFPYPVKVANFALEINGLMPVAIAESFFIAQTGNTYWGEEAEKVFEMENLIPLEEIDPLSKDLH